MTVLSDYTVIGFPCAVLVILCYALLQLVENLASFYLPISVSAQYRMPYRISIFVSVVIPRRITPIILVASLVLYRLKHDLVHIEQCVLELRIYPLIGS